MYIGKTVGVILAAAGSGVRAGGNARKQFLEIASKPVWIHTLEKFQQCSHVDFIVVAGPSNAVEDMKRAAPTSKLIKLSIVRGGEHRQDSVRAALDELRKFTPEIILVHDAVRPFVSHTLIEAVLEGALAFGAAVPALHPKETVKFSNGNNFVEATPWRNSLWLVQTPQGFQASLLYRAFEKASRDGFYGTDDSSLVERTGIKVKIVDGAYENLKITTSEDLLLAEFLMRKRGLFSLDFLT